MLVPNRNYSSPSYRYGFGGQEKDDEIKGEGNSINYKFRMHDPRVGRFFAPDPFQRAFPWNSSYAFSENRVIRYAELEGAEIYDPMIGIYLGMKWAKIKKKFSNGLNNAIEASTKDVMNIEMGNYDAPDRQWAERERAAKLIGGLSDMAEVSEDILIGAAETINTIPGIDTVGDPLLALYFGQKAERTDDSDDIISAGAYATATFVPFASGAVIKLTGKGAVQLLKKSTKYNFKITGRVRDDILSSINNPGLKDAFINLYRKTGSIGNGGTAAAVIEEGVGGKHWKKAHDRLGQLKDLVSSKDVKLTNDDMKVANQLIGELKEAIDTAKKATDK